MVGLSAASGKAGEGDSLGYVREFLTEYPDFIADGTMTSNLVNPTATYRCRVEIRFRKTEGMTFRYNTHGARNIIPYDYEFADKQLTESIYNRDRSELLERKVIGAPTRSLFNFVWEVVQEAEKGAGVRSLILGGLMSVEQTTGKDRSQIVLERRFPGIPIQKVSFLFDDERRLRGIDILRADGGAHHLLIRRFRRMP